MPKYKITWVQRSEKVIRAATLEKAEERAINSLGGKWKVERVELETE
tara:strand:+ start:207 stop:347 length:141 start_codon:yes stop_codon:yes gene_type:complete